MPNGPFNICCPRDCVSRHNGGTSGAPLKPLRVDSLRGAPEVPPLCRETQSLGQQMLTAPLGINGLINPLFPVTPFQIDVSSIVLLDFRIAYPRSLQIIITLILLRRYYRRLFFQRHEIQSKIR